MPFPFGTWACEFDCTSLDYITEREQLSELSMMFLRVDIIRVIFPCELGRWLKKSKINGVQRETGATKTKCELYCVLSDEKTFY